MFFGRIATRIAPILSHTRKFSVSSNTTVKAQAEEIFTLFDQCKYEALLPKLKAFEPIVKREKPELVPIFYQLKSEVYKSLSRECDVKSKMLSGPINKKV